MVHKVPIVETGIFQTKLDCHSLEVLGCMRLEGARESSCIGGVAHPLHQMVSIAVKSQQLLFIMTPATRSEKESTLDCTQEEEVRRLSLSLMVILCFAGDISNVRLAMVTDLNGPTPQFSLTCISTGGPVTWTRDSTTVTEGTETVLDDPETSQYTHILNVTTAGEYTCTVSNNKPSSNSATYMLEGAQNSHIIEHYVYVSPPPPPPPPQALLLPVM